MKALSIRQPWAWAILHAGKDVENRKWNTNYRGQFLIHASKGMTRGEYEDAAEDILKIAGISPPAFEDLERGGIVGKADLRFVCYANTSPWFNGPYGFVLFNAQPLPFRELKGTLNFFDVDMAGAA